LETPKDSNLEKIAVHLGYNAGPTENLKTAFNHSSWAAENSEVSNERLEFLGDAVLSLVVAEFIYLNFPHLPEGDLAKLRAEVVSTETLVYLAEKLGLRSALKLGKGEEEQRGRDRSSSLEDCFEAVIGALYLDLGLDEARGFIIDQLKPVVMEAGKNPGTRDHKTRLQEELLKLTGALPIYETAGEGPDHSKVFRSKVKVDEITLGEGVGTSKRRAEQQAARLARKLISEHPELVKIDSRSKNARVARSRNN
jgi:ribonuclease-3